MTTDTKFHITEPEKLTLVTQWVLDDRGLRIWKSHDLGAGRPELLCPRDVEHKPHWAYCSYEDITPEEVEVQHRNYLNLPPEWFPKCDKCKGSGKRSYQEIASIRNQSVSDVKTSLNEQGIFPPIDDDHFACNYCNGTGHTVEKIKVRVKREYWGGFTMSDAGKRKGEAMCFKLKSHYEIRDVVEFDYEYIENGLAPLRFYSVVCEKLSDHVKKLTESRKNG